MGRWEDRKVDRWEGRLAGRWEDRKEGRKVDRWEGRKEVLKVDRWGDPRGGRRAGRTVARKVGLVVLQAAWVEALVLGLWEPPVALLLRIPRSAA